MGYYYLLDNENPYATVRENNKKGNYYPYRGRDIQGIVVHTAENGRNAKDIAKHLSKTDKVSSAHVVIDDKNIVNLLPDDYTAFHARGHNSRSLGIELAYNASDWGIDKEYENQLITTASKWATDKCEVYEIPARRLNINEWLKGQKGFISSSELDPVRRADPGINFPWEQFFTLIKGKSYRKAQRQAPKWNGRILLVQAPLIKGDDVSQWQDAAGGLTVDGIYGQSSRKRCREIQKLAGLVLDGLVGPQTWYATFGLPEIKGE